MTGPRRRGRGGGSGPGVGEGAQVVQGPLDADPLAGRQQVALQARVGRVQERGLAQGVVGVQAARREGGGDELRAVGQEARGVQAARGGQALDLADEAGGGQVLGGQVAPPGVADDAADTARYRCRPCRR
ncbi:hypothetical protein GCM10009678_12440 [Actinomadura kijaniata]